MKINNKNNNSMQGIIFDIFNYIFLGLYALAALLPFVYIVAASFATDAEIADRPFFLLPRNFTTEAYGLIFHSNTLFRSLGVSVFVTVTGTLIALFCTITFAYPLSKKNLIGRGFVLNCIIFTMVFSGGMIPSYLIIRNLGFINKYWALIIPGAINTTNLIIVKNFFQALPGELMEAAEIDGCTEMQILWKIVLPLSKPILATFGLFYAVGHWNDFFSSLLYINDPKKWPLQVLLRQIVMLSQATLVDASSLPADYVPPAQSMKMATIVVGIIPIMLVYPFLQKYFAKGVMIGAVKG
jgi:putative aldouronate transport system permease protein